MHDIAVISERSEGLLKSRTPMQYKVDGVVVVYSGPRKQDSQLR